MLYRFPWHPALIGIGVLTLALVIRRAGWGWPFHILGLPCCLFVYGCGGWWWLRHVARPHSTEALIARRADLDQRSGGVATRLDIAEHASAKTLRLKACVLRPPCGR